MADAPNIETIWQKLAGDTEVSEKVSSQGGTTSGRREFIDAAQEVAELSLPALRPNGSPISIQPYSSLPGKAIRGLSSRLIRTLFPVATQWFDYQLSADVDRAISVKFGEDPQAEAEVRAQIKELFAERRGLVNKFIGAKKVKAKITSFVRRMLVEGQGGMQVLKDKVRTFPLRQIVVKRHSGEVLFWVIKESRRVSATEFSNQTSESFVYTLIDEKGGKVWQQIDQQPAEDQEGKDGGDVRQYILAEVEFPEIEDYVHGFAWHFKGLMNEIDNLSASLGEATANAAWAVLLISPTANVTAEEVKKQWRSGHAVIGNFEAFNWLTSGVKLSDWSFVGSVLNDLRGDLREIFLDEEPSVQADVTATAVLQRIERIDAQTADLMVALETSLQQKIVVAVEVVIGLSEVLIEGLEGPIQVAITTGQSALQQDQRSMRALQKIQIVQGVDQFTQVDGVRLLEEIGRGDGFDYDRVVSRVDPRALVEQNAGVDVAGAIPGTSQQTAGGPQPTLEPAGEEARRTQQAPPAAA